MLQNVTPVDSGAVSCYHDRHNWPLRGMGQLIFLDCPEFRGDIRSSESPQRVRRNYRWMIQNLPVLVDYRKESIHLIGDFLEVGRAVIPHIDRLLAVTSPKLRNISDSRVVQGPKCVLVEKLDALQQANLDAIREQVILSQKVLLLNFRVKSGIVFFSDGHQNLRGDKR